MASHVENISDAGFYAFDDPRQALALATGAEIGLFGGGPPEFAPTCVRSCLTSPETGSVDGACEVVRRLAERTLPEDDQRARICDKGHAIGIHAGVASDVNVLVLHPTGRPVDGSDEILSLERTAAIARLWQHFERLSQESQGLALELIGSYEQLNVIFNITKELGAVRDVKQIEVLLLRCLAETLACDWACCISDEDEAQWWCIDDRISPSATVEWIHQALGETLETVRAQRRIIVPKKHDADPDPPAFTTIVGPLESVEDVSDVVVLGRRRGQPFKSGDMQMLDSVLSFGGQVVSNVRLMARLKTLSLEAVLALVSAIDKKDTCTSGHSERVGFISRLVGEAMGLPETDLQDLEWAGILHDVGKIGISDGILTKPGKLTEDEFDLIKQHPRMSFEVLEPLRSFGKVRQAVLHHHETPDGQGYPDGLRGDEIPLLARIVHVADTFDALTSDRAYRRGFPIGKALEIMRQDAGTKIDAEVLRALVLALENLRTREPHRYKEMLSHAEELTE